MFHSDGSLKFAESQGSEEMYAAIDEGRAL